MTHAGEPLGDAAPLCHLLEDSRPTSRRCRGSASRSWPGEADSLQRRAPGIWITSPDDVSVIYPTIQRPGPALTLVGCYPFYHVGSAAPQRFIVRAVSAAGPANERLTRSRGNASRSEGSSARRQGSAVAATT